MVAGVVFGLDYGLDPGEGTVERGRAVAGKGPLDARELVAAADGEGTAQPLLIGCEDVDAQSLDGS